MNIKENITISFDENDLKQVVAQYLKGKGYKCESKDVHFNLGTVCYGYGMSESEKTPLS